MEKPLHIKLLQELSNEGVGRPHNIMHFLWFAFPLEGGSKSWRWDIEGKPAIFFLKDLTRRMLIDFDDPMQEDNPLDNIFPFEKGTGGWYQQRIGMCFITSEGLDYLDKYESDSVNSELNKSYLRINNETIRNYTIQKWLLGATAILSLVSVLLAAFDYKKPEPELKPLVTSVQLISKQILSLKEQIKSQQGHKVVFVEKSRKPRPSASSN